MSKGTDLILEAGIPGYGEDEVGFMEKTLIMVRPSFIGDWGTNRGSSARIFSELSRFHKIKTTIVTVDLPQAIARLDRDHASRETGQWLDGHQIRRTGDGVTTALTEWALLDQPLPALFFLDGDHSYHNVYRELTYIRRLIPSATILIHDTRLSPGKAVDEFVDKYPDHYNLDRVDSQAGMWRLWPR